MVKATIKEKTPAGWAGQAVAAQERWFYVAKLERQPHTDVVAYLKSTDINSLFCIPR